MILCFQGWEDQDAGNPFRLQTFTEQLWVRHCPNTKGIRLIITILDPTTASRADTEHSVFGTIGQSHPKDEEHRLGVRKPGKYKSCSASILVKGLCCLRGQWYLQLERVGMNWRFWTMWSLEFQCSVEVPQGPLGSGGKGSQSSPPFIFFIYEVPYMI